ncbi:MAG: DUF1848 domain-containing protein [Erysipelotrichaceae bacterium]|nr:DUF1848 domain-containing protein [Erysipelotrichaceae bacterium]
MILNTGSRTDIPAFYSEWFMNRIRAGFVMARNPYYPKQVIKYRLDPESVEILVFCSKDPSKILKYLDELKDYRIYFNVTITPYGKDIEPNVPDKKGVLESFKRLSEKLGVKKVVWRYDPIFLSERYDLEYHLQAFEKMAKELKGYTSAVIISFIDLYEKTKRNFPSVREVSFEDQCTFCEAFVKIASKYDMKVRLCHEDERLERYGADASGCLSREVLEEAFDIKLKPVHNQSREGCACLLGNDIGAYNSCLHLCRYCYANYDERLVRNSHRKHDPLSPLLIGNLEADDEIKENKAVSVIDEQLTLF